MLRFSFTPLFLILWSHFQQRWKLFPCQSLCLERFRLSGFQSACFNQYCTTCVYLTGRLLADHLFDFLYFYLASISKIKWRNKKRGFSRHRTTCLIANWNAKYVFHFWKTPGPELSFQREMQPWIICVLFFCLPSNYLWHK